MCQNEAITCPSPSLSPQNSLKISSPDKDLSHYLDYIDKPYSAPREEKVK